jgi:protein TonB
MPAHAAPSGSSTAVDPLRPPTIILTRIPTDDPPGQTSTEQISLAWPGDGIPGGIGNPAPGPHVVVATPSVPNHPVRLSGLVVEGLLIRKTVPRYPAIAIATRTEGTVILQATISKAGTIENLRVVSGSPMLRQAAIEAVQSWLYKPYLLSGEPVEVDTTVNVVFSLERN